MAAVETRRRGNLPESEDRKSPPSRESTPIEYEPVDDTTEVVQPDSDTITSEEPLHVSFRSNFPTIIYQLRSLHVIAIVLQMVILYMESDRMGLAVAIPLAIHLVNFYHTGRRLYQNIDGRFDLQQIFNAGNFVLKGRYVYAVFASLFYSTLSLFIIGEIPSTISAVLYTVSKFTSVGCSGLVVAAEIFEAVMNQFGQSSAIPSKQL